jgi:perosamine synthetase
MKTVSSARRIPLCEPEIRGNAWKYVRECLDSGWVSSVGEFVSRFEREVAARLGSPFGVATVSGTAALHTALVLAGVGPDEEVLVPSLTFIAPANAVRYAGAWPVFIDAEPRFWQMDPEAVRSFLDACDRRESGVYDRATGRRVSAILPVDILGHPVNWDPLRDAAATYGLPLVEDATESLGASFQGRPVGTLGDVACLSFNGNKLITTGGGGMVLTAREAWANRARYLTTQAKDDPIEFVHREVGYNYRLTNLQAALGCAQLELLDEYAAAKRKIAARYAEALGDLPGVTLMPEAPWARSVFWMYTILVNKDEFGLDSRELARALDEDGIVTRPLWQPLHRSPAHRGAPAAECPVAERLNRDSISLPCSVGLSPADQDFVVDRIRSRAARNPIRSGS